MARVFFLAVDDHFDDAVLGRRGVVAAVLVAAAGAHARDGYVRFAFGQAVVFKLLHELVELHPAHVVGHAPQRPLRGIGDNARRLSVDKLVVIAQAGGGYALLVVLCVDRLDGGAHDTVVTGHHRIFKT